MCLLSNPSFRRSKDLSAPEQGEGSPPLSLSLSVVPATQFPASSLGLGLSVSAGGQAAAAQQGGSSLYIYSTWY